MGVLYPGLMVAWPDHAFLNASLTPFAKTERLPVATPNDQSAAEPWAPAAGSVMKARCEEIIGVVALTDDQGTRYALRVEAISGNPGQGQQHGLVWVRLGVDPVPARDCGWLELRGQYGSAARLFAHPTVRVSRLAPVSDGGVGRLLTDQALMLIGIQLSGAGQNAMERYCSRALARAAEVEQSGESGAAELHTYLARLCAVLTGRGSADELPPEWSSILSAAERTDGPRRHFDVSVGLPPVEATAVRVDRLVSESGSWEVFLTSEPGWWAYSVDGRSKRALISVRAEDDLGGLYVTEFGGSTEDGNHAEVKLRFLPRLNPRARALTLTFTGRNEQVTLELFLP